jgi:alpha-galactosidase
MASHLKFLADREIILTDLWTGKEQRFTGEAKFRVEPRQTLMLTASGSRELEDGLYLSEQPGNVNPAVDGVGVPQHDPAIHRSVIHWLGTRGNGDHPQYGGWGGAQADRSPFGDPIRVAGKLYRNGIGILANSRLEVKNQGYARLVTGAGIDDAAAARGQTVTFEIYGDGRLLARSQPVRFGQPAAPLEADVRGIKLIELVARAEGAGEGALPVAWTDAALMR